MIQKFDKFPEFCLFMYIRNKNMSLNKTRDLSLAGQSSREVEEQKLNTFDDWKVSGKNKIGNLLSKGTCFFCIK